MSESVLQTEPSFCIYTDDEFGEQVGNAEVMREKIERTATIGDNIEAEFKDLKIEIGGEQISPPIHEPKTDGRDAATLNKWRNHAQYLESTGDLYGAEEYYFQAMEADPNDGEVMSQYAKLVWQLHGDQARASRYFEKATVAAPANSDVLAAYASFLWDIDESEEEEHLSDGTQKWQVDENPVLLDALAGDYKEETRPSSPPLHLAMGLGINGAGFGGFNDAVDYMNSSSDDSTNVEDYYRRMVEENPRNAGFLRDYALFLHQKKGDLQGAEEYYSRAILEDPRDGQMMSLYAGIVWQLHGDKVKASAYFERAIEASPENSNVLAAYAKFLWEIDAEEDVEDEAQRISN
ncbi:hypothetical protein C2S52_015087 [Perilla frutescens var. hirtella]|nr:hypothetical protein C2S52_015087 [Perilla frutescens var. hirtella]